MRIAAGHGATQDTNIGAKLVSSARMSWRSCAGRRSARLKWKSIVLPDGGEGLGKRKDVAARRGLKEAWSKAATGWTRTRILRSVLFQKTR